MSKICQKKLQKSYKEDIKIEWDKATKTVRVRWTDYELRALGKKGNSRYRNDQRKCGIRYKRAEAEAELQALAEREQQASIERAKALCMASSGEKPAAHKGKVVASSFLRNMTDEQITTSKRQQTINDCRKDLLNFCDWLDQHHPNIELHKITKLIAAAYLRSLDGKYTYSSMKTFRAHLVKVFKSVLDIMEESTKKYTNAFAGVSLKDVVTNRVENRKSIYTIEQLAYILKRAGESKFHKKSSQIQQFAIFYMLMVTGWRVGDIAKMEWSCVDFKKRVVTNVHGKTMNTTGVHTKIYMTNLMKEILTAMQKLKRDKQFQHFIFSVDRHGNSNLPKRVANNALTHIENMRKELVLQEVSKKGKYSMHAHATHSFRSAFITHMTGGRFPEALVDYICGHNLKGVNAQHYMRYDSDPELYTREIIETMEKLIDARHAFRVALYGEGHACGLMVEGDSIEGMPDDWDKYLIEEKFWKQDAIDAMIMMMVIGNPPSVIKQHIQQINALREETGARWVDVEFLQKHTSIAFRGTAPNQDAPEQQAAYKKWQEQQAKEQADTPKS